METAAAGINFEHSFPNLLDLRFADNSPLFGRNADEMLLVFGSLMEAPAEVRLLFLIFEKKIDKQNSTSNPPSRAESSTDPSPSCLPRFLCAQTTSLRPKGPCERSFAVFRCCYYSCCYVTFWAPHYLSIRFVPHGCVIPIYSASCFKWWWELRAL
jgi:hypothetical protein